jgi:lambda family phage portal protein
MARVKTRAYSAASTQARYGDFSSYVGSADYELLGVIDKLRTKVRHLAQNSGTVRRFLQLLGDNVVGEYGFTLHVMNQRVKDAWVKWCQSPTVDGIMTMVDFQRQMVKTWGRDGEYLFEFVMNSKYPDMIAMNPLEADMLDHTLNHIYPPTGNRIKMGVEIDSMGVPIAYHILTVHPGDTFWSIPDYDKRWRRVPAENIVHVFERLRPGQTRGEPPAVASVNDIKMLDGYREAETTNRRIAAAMMGFFSRDMPKGEGIQALSDRKDDDEAEDIFEMSVEPGKLRQMPDGMRFDKFDPGGSNTDYAQYEQQVKKDLSMGLGISAFSLGMETQAVSYSTGRSVIQEDREFYKNLQGFFIRLAMRRIFSKWATMHTLSNVSSIAPTRLSAIIDEAQFKGRGWTWIDPLKDITATAMALETYQTSYTRVAADRGLTANELFAEIANDRALMETFGLQPVTAPVKSTTSALTANVPPDKGNGNGKPAK